MFLFVFGLSKQSLKVGGVFQYDESSAATCYFNWPYTYVCRICTEHSLVASRYNNRIPGVLRNRLVLVRGSESQ